MYSSLNYGIQFLEKYQVAFIIVNEARGGLICHFFKDIYFRLTFDGVLDNTVSVDRIIYWTIVCVYLRSSGFLL